MDAASTKPEKVGILLIHGIGEQSQFEHLETETRNIIAALQERAKDPDDIDVAAIKIEVRTSANAAFGATQQTWKADDAAPLVISVKDATGHKTDLSFHEVWWADLDEPTTFKGLFSFWKWGLSLWVNPGYIQKKSSHRRQDNKERPPELYEQQKNPKISIVHRMVLFCVAMVIALTQPVLSIISWILRQVFGSQLHADILVQYLGDVKLYQQKGRSTKGPLMDIGRRPRVSIKRRIIQNLVRMELANYDRWYVLAHSLGTIVAFNGLTEDEAMLPNYLGDDLLAKWQAKHGTRNVARRTLFQNLRGLITYGSPLSKFAVLWPAIVPLNKDEKVFVPSFEWINIYDPSDPVSAKTKFFEPKMVDGKTSPNAIPPVLSSSLAYLKPREIAYKADNIHLLSHISYMVFKPRQPDRLVHSVISWLVKDRTFEIPQQSKRWLSDNQIRQQVILQTLIWLVAGVIMPVVFGLLLGIGYWIFRGSFPMFTTLVAITLAYISFAIWSVLIVGSLEHLRRLVENVLSK